MYFSFSSKDQDTECGNFVIVGNLAKPVVWYQKFFRFFAINHISLFFFLKPFRNLGASSKNRVEKSQMKNILPAMLNRQKKMKRLSLTISRKSATISQIAQRTTKFIIKTMFLFLWADNKIHKIILKKIYENCLKW